MLPGLGFGSGFIWESSSLKVFIWFCQRMEHTAESLRERGSLYPGHPASSWPPRDSNPTFLNPGKLFCLESRVILAFSQFLFFTPGHKSLNPHLSRTCLISTEILLLTPTRKAVWGARAPLCEFRTQVPCPPSNLLKTEGDP